MLLSKLLNSTLVQIGIVILIAAILQFLGHHFIARFIRRMVKRGGDETKTDERKRENTIIVILRTTFTAFIWISTIVIILTKLGVNVTALLTGAGIVGVFIGLSAQTTVKDLLAGMFILIEKQYRVGDVITLSGGTTGAIGATGTVEAITLRITKLRDLNGTLITVRNGEPTIIVNQTFSYSTVLLDITVTYESDITQVQKVMDAVGLEIMSEDQWKDKFTAPVKFERVDNFTDTGVVVRAVGTVSPASQWDVAGEYRRRLLLAIAKKPNIKLAHS